jgi:hypothetical protein
MERDQEDIAVVREADTEVACEANTEISCSCQCHEPGHGETTACFACDCDDISEIYYIKQWLGYAHKALTCSDNSGDPAARPLAEANEVEPK